MCWRSIPSRQVASASSTSALPSALVGFGVPRSTAVLGVATYRLAQFFFPILLGGVLYGRCGSGRGASSVVTGCGTSARHRRGRRRNDERALDFSVRFAQRRKAAGDPTVELPFEIAGR